jgi:predicted transcriptional regulator
MPKAGRGSDAFVVRLPDGMRERIRKAAETNNRSMNAEIVSRLESSFIWGDEEDERDRNGVAFAPGGVSVDDFAQAFERAHKQAYRVALKRLGITVRTLSEGEK